MQIARLLGLTIFVLALAVGTASAASRLAVHPTTVARGHTVTFSGHGCLKGDTVFLISKLFPGHAYGVGAIQTIARAGGTFSRTYRVRMTTPRGRYGITARCGGGNLGVVAHLRVT